MRQTIRGHDPLNRRAWTGTITRRLSAIFLVFALAPMVLVTLFAFQTISEKARQQVEELQYEHAGMMSDTLLGRLVVLGEQLRQFSNEAAESGYPVNGQPHTIGENVFRVFPPVAQPAFTSLARISVVNCCTWKSVSTGMFGKSSGKQATC